MTANDKIHHLKSVRCYEPDPLPERRIDPYAVIILTAMLTLVCLFVAGVVWGGR